MEEQQAGLQHNHFFYKDPQKPSGLYICWKHACFFVKYGILYFLAFALAFTSLTILAVGAYSSYYADKAVPTSTIAAHTLTGLTRKESQTLLEEMIYSYEKNFPITIIHETGSLQPTLEQLGVTISPEKTIHNLFSKGHETDIASRLISNGQSLLFGNEGGVSFTINRDTLDNYLAGLQKQFEEPVQNAVIEIENLESTIKPEENGQKLNKAAIELGLIHSLTNLDNITMELPLVTVEPSITGEDLAPTKNLTATIISQAVTLTYEQKLYTITREQIAGWLLFREFRPEQDEATQQKTTKKLMEVHLNNQEVLNFIQKNIAAEIDQKPEESTVIKASQKTQVLKAGKEGKILDKLQTLGLIQEKLLEEGERIIELPVETMGTEEEEADIPPAAYEDKKHIIVSLSQQLAFAYSGEELVFVTKVSTGIPGHATPKGQYKVYGKTAKQKMSGPGYYLPNVPWILWYNGDYSLHGTYWHNNFGTTMSHGCTNLSIDDAKWFYDFAEVGTPVINVD